MIKNQLLLDYYSNFEETDLSNEIFQSEYIPRGTSNDFEWKKKIIFLTNRLPFITFSLSKASQYLKPKSVWETTKNISYFINFLKIPETSTDKW